MISIYPERKEDRVRLYVTGHAEYAEENDVVCAAVSALVGALVLYAQQNENCHHLRSSVEPGRVFFSCKGEICEAFDAVMTGLSALARDYGRHVQIFSVNDNGAQA